MKNNKLVVLLAFMSFLVAATCFFATVYVYYNNQNVLGLNSVSATEQKMKDELKTRLEQAQSLSSINVRGLNFVFNDSFPFPARDFFATFEQEMNNLFEQQRKDFVVSNQNAVRSSTFMIEDTKDIFKVSAILQNVTKEMLDVTIEKGFLIVKAEKSQNAKKDEQQSMASSKIHKVIKLPKNVVANKADVSYKEGILIITMPKTELKEEKPIKLEVK